MHLKFFITFLISIVVLSSCDMSRWYFRHGGKSSKVKSDAYQVHEKIADQSQVVAADSPDTVLAEQVTQPNIEVPEETPVSTRVKDEIRTEESPQGQEKESFENKNIQQQQPTTHARQHINGAAYIWFFLLILVLLLVFIGGMVLLISWIFVPIAMALRIALWVVAILLASTLAIILFVYLVSI